MKKLIAGVAVAVVAAVGIGACSSTDKPSTEPTMTSPDTLRAGWTPAGEQSALALIGQQPQFAQYAPQCVLDQVKKHFTSLSGLTQAAARLGADDPAIRGAGQDVAAECPAL
jgi:hypothetical protein